MAQPNLTGRALITRADGTVAVMYLYDDADAEAELAKWPEDQRSTIAAVEMIPEDAVLPADRRFRDAWRRVGHGRPDVDMPAARAVHLARLRARRNRALAALDGTELRAMASGDAAALQAVRAEKQRLRDLPQALTAELQAAADPDALETVGATAIDDPV